jgi:hypothetical protein
LLAWLNISIVAVLLGKLFADNKGVLGALIGSLLAGSFFALTALVAKLTIKTSVEYLGFAVLGSWLGKIVLLLAVLFWLRNVSFYDRPTLFGTLVVSTIGLLTLEAYVITRTPALYVEPRA